MNQKNLIVVLILSSLLSYLPLFASDIPQTLKKLGFIRYVLIYYEKNGDKEIFTFSDGTDKKSRNTVTFIVKNGKVLKYYKAKPKSEQMKPKGLKEE